MQTGKNQVTQDFRHYNIINCTCQLCGVFIDILTNKTTVPFADSAVMVSKTLNTWKTYVYFLFDLDCFDREPLFHYQQRYIIFIVFANKLLKKKE